MSNVTLTCDVSSDNGSSDNGSSFTVTSYQWNSEECYTNPNFNDSNPSCFPHGQTTQTVTDDNVTAEDSGTITCTVSIDNKDYTSNPFTLRISGREL